MQVVPTIDSKTLREFESSVSAKGQVTLPLEVRKKFAVQAKDKIVFRVQGDMVTLTPSAASLDAVYMSVPALKTPKTLTEIREIIHAEQTERVAKELGL